MLETILTTVLSSALYITSSAFAPQATAPGVSFTQVLPVEDYVSYTVETEESLAAISQKYYGTDIYWTNIWNDNSWISDPERIETGARLKISATQPVNASELASVLAERDAKLVEQKNQEYLKSIGYLQDTETVAVTIPTITPVITQAPMPVATSNTASAISEEAVTYLGNCEAGMDPAKNTGNGYYGAFQFSSSTWNNLNTGYARADLAPLEVQKAAVQQLLQKSNIYNQFPGCANKMRNAGLI